MTARRTYEVTIKPRHAMYAGGWASGEYTVQVWAKDRNEAIRFARRDYEDGAVNPATFTARLAKPE